MNKESKQPTILPWHREAAKEIGSLYWAAQQDDDFPQDSEVAAIIARHDATNNEVEAAKAKKTAELFVDATGYPEELRTLKAQHAETLRLLEQAAVRLDILNEVGSLHEAIRAHLAAMQQSAKQEGNQ